MSASRFIQRIEAAGFHMEVEGDGIAITPASRLTDQQRQFIRQHRPEILAALTGKPPAPAVEPAPPAYHPEAVRTAICAVWVWHQGQWFAPGTREAKETSQEARRVEPATTVPSTQNHAATGGTGGGHAACGDCQHYTPNRYGMGGLGNCAVLADPPGPFMWPRAERRCARFAPANGSTSKAAVLDAAHDNIIPTSTPTDTTLETQP